MAEFVRFTNSPEVFSRAERRFQQLAAILRPGLPRAEILHIGGTALPGLWTKGDLDIVVRVPANALAAADEFLATLFARNLGSDRTAEFASFYDSASDPPLGVQLVAVDSPYDDFHHWLGVLQRDAKLRAAYEELKLRFQGRAMDDYRAAKTRFIADALHGARDDEANLADSPGRSGD